MTSIAETIERALDAAGLRDRASVVREKIDSALAAAGLRPSPGKTLASIHRRTEPLSPVMLKDAGGVYELNEVDERISQGTFGWHTYGSGGSSLRYKLFVPSTHRGRPLPLIVMLHGCKQNPDDFAAGTCMNALAAQSGFLVAYPAQEMRDNGSNCWNWFDPSQQQREGREPSLVAGMVGHIASRMPVDRSKVFVAGLSAGGAMAVVLGRRYPEIFSGIAVHSGLPLGVAHDVQSAFAAMRGQSTVGYVAGHAGPMPRTIVFHGEADTTVVPSNGKTIVQHAISSFEEHGTALQETSTATTINGRHCVRTDLLNEQGRVMVREWMVRGGGHTWFGGNRQGSYADPTGPDASAELLRFFLTN